MKIKLTRGKPASDEMCASLEAALGCKLSESFRSFLRSNDGAKPEPNRFEIGDNNGAGVSEFIPANEILQERNYIENIPDKAYPVALAEGGNYVFIDEHKNGAVFFWDHELPEDITELAPNFGAFLDLLEPFDIETVVLKPGQVKRVWIHPDFLKKLQEEEK